MPFLLIGRFSMLKEQNRIKKRKEFGYIHKNGNPIFGTNMVLLFTENKFKKVRVGFSVSKKVGKAHIRNKIKRQLRAIVREYMPNILTSTNYVIIAKPTIVDLSFDKMKKECVKLFTKVAEKKEIKE